MGPTMKLSRLLAVLVVVAAPGLAAAQEKVPAGAKGTKLDVRPAKVGLDGRSAYRQLLVTATLDNGETMDATRIAKFETPATVTATGGLVRPKSDGAGEIVISLDGQAAKVPVN